jgi:purine-nucleoside phosphorylase
MSKIQIEILEKLYEIAYSLARKLNENPEFVISSGSGFSGVWDKFNILQRISFNEINSMPTVNVEGHGNEIVVIQHSGKIGLVFTGRFHLYEDYSIEEILIPIIIPCLFGVKNFILFNAAGGLNPKFNVGDIMIIEDIINFTSKKIQSIFNSSFLIDRDFSCDIFAKQWISRTEAMLSENKISYHKGTYIEVTGPTYETRAEVKMFRTFGGDAIGMSTALESIAASLLKTNVLAFSIITNQLKEVRENGISHQEVLNAVLSKQSDIEKIIDFAIQSID